MFANRLKKNFKHISRWARKNNISCFRVYDADIPEYSVAIDLFEKWVHVQEYIPKKEINSDKAQKRLDEIIEAIPSILQVSPENIFLKQRQHQKGSQQYEKITNYAKFYEVSEFNCKFLLNFESYLDTGLFLDHRNTRKMIQQEANGKTVLNLFAYTGTASVHAALGGATKITTIDISNTYIKWAKQNFELNNLDPEQYEFCRADCLAWLRKAKKKFDLIFLDPPSFSNSKKMKETLDIQRDHITLINLTMKHLHPDGLLIFSNNNRKFKMDDEITEKYSTINISKQSIPLDFQRNTHIHNCWKISHSK
jgi:23S rRNA (guanine2445-N2)-methyltransferase / 23S rRNA (guanine2069-N7)-methyltransferase